MLILKGHSLTASRKIVPESMSLSLKERESTATITLGPDAPALSIGTWLQDETDPGAGIVWRVKSIRQAFGTNTTTVQLEHVVSALKDLIIFGEKTPADITGKKTSKTCTAKEAVQFILKQQSDWALGSFEFSVSNPYKFDGDNLFDALQTVSGSLADCWWSYDFSSYPFRISFVKKSTSIGTVLRVGRNLTNVNKTIDKSGMFTRFYPIGKDDLHLSGGGYAEKNTAAYGVVSKVETDQTITTQAELKRWANERLNVHAAPVVTIDVEGVELRAATGEGLDGLKLGRQCYVPLAEFGTEILETISELNYQDKIRKPEVFRAVLANSRQDVTKIIAEEIRRGGGGGRAAARQQKEDHAWFEDTTERVSMVASNLKDTEARIDVMDGEISLKVNKSGVISAINLSPEGAVIQGNRITLAGTVWATDINSLKADVDDLSAGDFTGVSMKCFTLAVNSNYMTLGGSTISKQTYNINGTDYKLLHWN
ncbi:MAG: phage tail protein [Clostridia bacterium]|nr:phage tail protein [Clostridia bacterium]